MLARSLATCVACGLIELFLRRCELHDPNVVQGSRQLETQGLFEHSVAHKRELVHRLFERVHQPLGKGMQGADGIRLLSGGQREDRTVIVIGVGLHGVAAAAASQGRLMGK